jgi:hypothetical protein
MNKIALLAAFAALAAGQPAFAQSFVLIIGNFSAERAAKERTPMTDAERIELVAERACGKPHLLDLKGQAMFRDCVAETRAKMAAVVAEGKSLDGVRIAAR